jgi:hypothetical protein
MPLLEAELETYKAFNNTPINVQAYPNSLNVSYDKESTPYTELGFSNIIESYCAFNTEVTKSQNIVSKQIPLKNVTDSRNKPNK